MTKRIPGAKVVKQIIGMTGRRSLFFDAWQACLRAHYIHVLRTRDTVTEPTLRAVLLQSGLSEDDLDALVHEALASEADTLEPEEAAIELPTEIEPEIEEIYAEAIPEEVEEVYEPLEPVLEEAVVEEEEKESDPDEDTNEAADTDYIPPSPQQLSLF